MSSGRAQTAAGLTVGLAVALVGMQVAELVAVVVVVAPSDSPAKNRE